MKTPSKRAPRKRVSEVAAAPNKVEQLISSTLRALRQAYPTDAWAPGMVLSNLKDGEFYCALHRYPTGYNSRDRVVIGKARAISWESALEQVARDWINGPDALRKLKELVG